MPADFHIEPKLHMVFSKAEGVFTCADVLGHMDRLLRHPEFRPEFNQLLDFRTVTEIKLTNEEIKLLARRTIFSPTSKRAYVVVSDLQYGLGRMFASFRELEGEVCNRVFKSMPEALAWLALAAEPDPARFPLIASTKAGARQAAPGV